MDMAFLVSALFLAFAIAAAILALLSWWDGRRSAQALAHIADRLDALEAHDANVERVVRDEMARARSEADDRNSRLRMELGQGIAGFGESLQKSVTGLGLNLETRLGAFDANQNDNSETLRKTLLEAQKQGGEAMLQNAQALGDTQRRGLADMNAAILSLTERLELQQTGFGDKLTAALKDVTGQLQAMLAANENRQTQLRDTLTTNLDALRKDNEAKLEQMRATVEDKLQGTLDQRIGESFKIVSERLESVHKGLGEMQTLATGVGDLKRVLTNVKSRGGWAEMQLGALLENMLGPEQYVRNARIKPQSGEMVEYAIKMPGGDDGAPVLLPIDAKFPHEDYERLLKAQERAEPHEIELAGKELGNAIRREAKRIADKYIDPPNSTDFAIMYLPTEGLFAEVIRRDDLLSELQQRHKVTIAGPTTLTAFLTALQMGFRTLAVQKRSSEVWKVLGLAKAEFEKYGQVWDRLQKQLETAQKTVSEAGVRTRKVARALQGVEKRQGDGPQMLGTATAGDLLDADDDDPVPDLIAKLG